MTNQIDLVTVVRNMLADVREKTTQLADAQVALDGSRAQLVESQKDLSDYIKTVNELATEITSELSSTSLAEVATEAVADSLKIVKTVVVETVTKDVEPAKIAVSDESPAYEGNLTVTSAKGGPGKSVKPELARSIEPEAAPVVLEDEVADEIVAPEPKAEPVKVAAPSKKAATPEKVSTAPVGGLWDDDDDDDDSIF